MEDEVVTGEENENDEYQSMSAKMLADHGEDKKEKRQKKIREKKKKEEVKAWYSLWP